MLGFGRTSVQIIRASQVAPQASIATEQTLATVAWPSGSQRVRLEADIASADLAQVKSLEVIQEISTDGGVNWTLWSAFRWTGPTAGRPHLLAPPPSAGTLTRVRVVPSTTLTVGVVVRGL